MGLLQKLKSVLGLNGTGSPESGRSGDVDVTVEREPSTEDEDAVKGTETASSGAAVEPEGTEAAVDSADTESDGPSADEFETLADTDEADAAPDTETESAEAEATDTDETDAAPDTETESAEAEATDADDGAGTEPVVESEGSTDPVTELNGIGPAYGDRLAGAGIETVGELAVADAAELAEEIELGESRVTGWIEQASDY